MANLKTEIPARLRALADSDYKAFNERIITTGYPVHGIRMPALKKLAKEIAADPGVEAWLDDADFDTYEAVLLYGLVLGALKKPELKTVFRYLDPLILRFDNWAHVDTVIPYQKIFAKHREEVFAHFLPLKTHEGEFTKRVFVVVLMDFFMDDAHIDATLRHLTEIPQGQYYVDMAIAWAISVALVKHYERTLPYLEKPAFTKFVHNKAIQKARESCRIAPETKEFLKGMKIR